MQYPLDRLFLLAHTSYIDWSNHMNEELYMVCDEALEQAGIRMLTVEEIAALRYAAGIPAPRPAYQIGLDLVDLANQLLGTPCHAYTK